MNAAWKVLPSRFAVSTAALRATCCPATNRFAAIVPICGQGDPYSAERISHLPTWVFHGARDSAISVEASREMVKALRACGAPVKYTEYRFAGHDSWTRAYRSPDLFEWLLEQRLPDKAQPNSQTSDL